MHMLQVIEDFENGLEYAEAESILDVREAADCAREYFVRWSDGADDSWESEDSISSALVASFEAERKASTVADAKLAESESKQPAAV